MRALFVLACVVSASAWIAACGGGSGSGPGDAGGSVDATAPLDGAPPFSFGDGSAQSNDGAGLQGTLAISPSGVQTITVASGQSSPTVAFTSTLNGAMVDAGWSLDRGDVGRVSAGPSSTTTFTPTGTTGGLVTVTAGFAGKTATAQVFVKITAQQNGADPSNPAEQTQIPTGVAQLTSGGGVGGVGGEGLGVPVGDPATMAALRAPSSNGQAEGLTFLYPYDQTVWPRGLLAPLVMWQWSAPPTPGPLGPGADSGTMGDASAAADSAADTGLTDAPAEANLADAAPDATTADAGGDGGSIDAAGPDAGSDGSPSMGTSEAGASIDDADAILLTLSTTSGSFSWSGAFGRPAILAQTGGAFVRHPIPQDVWEAATNTAGGALPGGGVDRLTLSLTVARHGVAYGPISQTWTVAPGRLSGIIYYNSYGSQLAQNYGGAVGGNHQFGGAVLSIHVGDTAPQLVAGANGGVAQCRTCHSVAARGARLVVQHGDDYMASSSYDLTTQGSVEHVMTNASSFYPAVYPDGSFALDESGQILPLPSATTLPTVTGLSPVATDLGTPSFSPDGKSVVFNPLAGPGVIAPNQELVVMAFDAPTNTFSAPTVVVNDMGQPSATRPGYPAFLPDGQSVVFHHQSVPSADNWDQTNAPGVLSTRGGAKAQIAWTRVADAAHVTTLNALNGMDGAGHSYLPKLSTAVTLSCDDDGTAVGGIDADHSDDVNVNYEPTVNPVASGGYVWVVFTSRRMYGSEAAIPPFCSDPRGVDLIQNVTPKKLWVAAVDVGATPGKDASHPAFYLPAQELLAGNSRGFWVLDPCRQDGQSCQSGDQCCNGYCEPTGDGGALTCATSMPNGGCAQVNDKCTTAANCCDTTNLCINGFCTISTIR